MGSKTPRAGVASYAFPPEPEDGTCEPDQAVGRLDLLLGVVLPVVIALSVIGIVINEIRRH